MYIGSNGCVTPLEWVRNENA